MNKKKLRKIVWAILICIFPLYISITVQKKPLQISCYSIFACGNSVAKIIQESSNELIPNPFYTYNPQANISINNDFIIPDITFPSAEDTVDTTDTTEIEPPEEQTDSIQPDEKTIFEKILESIQGPTTGTTSGEGGGGGPVTPPVLTDCSTNQTVSQNIILKCYSGRRTYNTMLLSLENTNPTTSCQAEVFLNNTSGPALIDNFTSGNADFFLTLSTVSPANITLNNLPAPEKIGTWTEWNNNPLQVELVNGTLQSSNITQTYTIPPNQTRNLGLVVDCGTDTLSGETGTIKIQTNFFD